MDFRQNTLKILQKGTFDLENSSFFRHITVVDCMLFAEKI